MQVLGRAELVPVIVYPSDAPAIRSGLTAVAVNQLEPPGHETGKHLVVAIDEGDRFELGPEFQCAANPGVPYRA